MRGGAQGGWALAAAGALSLGLHGLLVAAAGGILGIGNRPGGAVRIERPVVVYEIEHEAPAQEARAPDVAEGGCGTCAPPTASPAAKKGKARQVLLSPVESTASAVPASGAGIAPPPAGNAPIVEEAAKATPAAPPAPDEKKLVEAIWKLVGAAAVYPPAAKRNGLEGLVKVSFRIGQDGKAAGISVAQSSGYPVLDDAAVAAVEKCAALPHVDKLVVVPVRFFLE